MNLIQRRMTATTALGMTLAIGVSPSAMAQHKAVVTDGNYNKIARYSHGPIALPFDHIVGAGLTTLDYAYDAIVGPDGLLYVTSADDSEILRYNSATGEPMGVFAISGTEAMNRPLGLAWGPDGNLYVSSHNNHRVVRFDGVTGLPMDTPESPGGVFITPGDGGLSQPHSLSFGPDSTADGYPELYVASFNSNRILRYNGFTGEFLDVFVEPNPGNLIGPVDLVFHEGLLYVTSAGNDKVLSYFSGSGAFADTVVTSAGEMANPQGLVFDPDDDQILYVVSRGNDSVQKYNAAAHAYLGPYISSGSGGIANPAHLLFVTDVDSCLPDLDQDGIIGPSDLAIILGNWGACMP